MCLESKGISSISSESFLLVVHVINVYLTEEKHCKVNVNFIKNEK